MSTTVTVNKIQLPPSSSDSIPGTLVLRDSSGNFNPQYSGFRNKIINGNFDIWQRGTTSTSTNAGFFTADRWQTEAAMGSGRSVTYSRQNFTAGQTEVFGAPKYFFRWDETVTGSGYLNKSIWHSIEGVNTFAGQTATLSFYAKSNAPINISVGFGRFYGDEWETETTERQNVSLTTSWNKFTLTFEIPSLSGKTITDFYDALWLEFRLPNTTTFQFDIARVQLEAGSTATPFEDRPSGIELALCQRFYEKGKTYITGTQTGGNKLSAVVNFNVKKYNYPGVSLSNFVNVNNVTNQTVVSVNNDGSGFTHGFTVNTNLANSEASGVWVASDEL